MENPEEKLKGLCKWVRETKGITYITIEELVEYLPEYNEWLEKNKKLN